MPIMKSVLGLDVGSHSVKAVELRQTFRGLEPAQMRVHPRADPDPVLERERPPRRSEEGILALARTERR